VNAIHELLIGIDDPGMFQRGFSWPAQDAGLDRAKP
jgi:hypothetical protein